MSAGLSKSFGLSSALKMTEEAMVTNKQGIVSILGADNDQRPLTKADSLRRTLSADMSSKKWLTQHGFSPLKKIASSEGFPVSILDSSSEEGEEDYEDGKETEARGQFDIWTSIQEDKKQKELERPGQFDIWNLIISQKTQEDSSKPLPPPYIHPLVKRSASSLSEKSLQICTESLGSETGSDGFSSYPPSETSSDMEEDTNKEEDHELQQLPQQKTCLDGEEARIVKYNNDFGKNSPHRSSFPPPIPSLSHKDGASLRMKTHRDNGRLVLEAVSVPSQNNFLASRQDGRLVLTFANTTPSEAESQVADEPIMNVEEEEEEQVHEVAMEEEFESFSEEEKESELADEEEEERGNEIDEGVEEDRSYVMEQAPKLSTGALNVHRLAVMMNKPIWLANRNPTWPKNFDEIVKLGEEIREKMVVDQPSTPPQPPLAQSLPPRPRVARLISSPPSTAAVAAGAAASFNAYEYYWRPNQPMSKAKILNSLAQQSAPPPPQLKDNNSNKQQLILSKNLMADNNQQKLLVLRGNKVDYFVPLSKGCKEPRRSLLFWEPYCIATS